MMSLRRVLKGRDGSRGGLNRNYLKRKQEEI